MAATPKNEILPEAPREREPSGGGEQSREKPTTIGEVKEEVTFQIDAKLAELQSRIEEEKRLKQQRPPEQRAA